MSSPLIYPMAAHVALTAFFHVACLLLIELRAVGPGQVVLAWVFVAGRLAHAGVQVFTTNMRLRGAVFTVNFLAVLGMWFLLLRACDGHIGDADGLVGRLFLRRRAVPRPSDL